MENDAGGIQNEFFNRVRKERTPVTVFLANGKRLIGRIKAFDKFTVLLDTHYGDQIIFKHAISTVGPTRSAGEDETAPQRDAVHPVETR